MATRSRNHRSASARPARRTGSPRKSKRRNGLPLFLLFLIVATTVLYSACSPNNENPSAPSTRPEAARQTERNEPEPTEPAKVTLTEESPAPEPPRPEELKTEPEPRPTLVEEPTVRLANPKPPVERPRPNPQTITEEPVAVANAAEWVRNPRATDVVALTFDGSYGDAQLPGMISILQQHGYRATFFLTGTFLRKFPNSVRSLASAGMEIGNHSWTHPRFTGLSANGMKSELERTSDRIEQLTGQRPRLFRPPYGDRNQRVLNTVAGEGYQTVYWALDCHDSVRKNITADYISKRVLDKVQPGDIVLMHINSDPTLKALPRIIEGLEKRGLKVAPVSEVMSR